MTVNGNHTMRKRTISLVAILVSAGGVWLNNTSLLSSRPAGTPSVLAHRGLAQDFDRTNLGSETCTAARMLTPRHSFLENTIPSMEAAFALGADALELDVHPTTDGKFAVFHDWTLDCRTNLLGPYSGGGFSQGLDDPASIDQLPDDYSGGISTDALDLVMPAVKRRFGPPV